MAQDETTQKAPISPAIPGVASGDVFGFRVILSMSEMATLTRALEEKVNNARWFAANNMFGGREKALDQCAKSEARITELKAINPGYYDPNLPLLHGGPAK